MLKLNLSITKKTICQTGQRLVGQRPNCFFFCQIKWVAAATWKQRAHEQLALQLRSLQVLQLFNYVHLASSNNKWSFVSSSVQYPKYINYLQLSSSPVVPVQPFIPLMDRPLFTCTEDRWLLRVKLLPPDEPHVTRIIELLLKWLFGDT
jgi:hypothetical protein